MIQGAIEYLLSNNKEAKILRKKFVFKIVPMLNPDGVVYGNYRCSLLGVDLNRRWKHPHPILHPTIYCTKKLVKILAEEREVALFCDFHGHSIKKNIFTYACTYRNHNSIKNKQNILIRLIPYLLSRINPNFSYPDSHFRTEKSKQATARVVNFKENSILTSYTLEASFYGSSSSDTHYSIQDLENAGRDLCNACMVFVSQKLFRSKIQEFSQFLKDLKQRKNEVKMRESKSSLNFFPVIAEEKLDFVEEDLQELKNFSIKEELERMQENEIGELIDVDDDSDSGGSDSQASLNDEKKIKFLLRKSKKMKKRMKSCKIQKNVNLSQINSCSQPKGNCISPDIMLKYRPKSKGGLRKRSEVISKQIIPAKIMFRSPFAEENSELRSRSSFQVLQTSGRSMLREAGPIKPLKKLKDFLTELGVQEMSNYIKDSIKKVKW